MVNLHLIMDAICIIILLFVLYKGYRNNILVRKSLNYNLSLFFSIVLCFCDGICILLDGKNGQAARDFNIIFNLIYMFSVCLAALFWNFFIIKKINYIFKINWKLIDVILSIPTAIMIILLFLSLKYNLIFQVNCNNIYIRGKLHFLHCGLLFFYLFFASITCLLCSLKIKNNYLKKEYISLAIFIIPTFIAGIVQLLRLEVPAISVGVSLGFLILYIEETERRAYVDYLTGLNNRYKLMLSYRKQIEKNTNNNTYLIITDINNFKQINDKYGHLAGDNALKEVAMAFIECCNDDFIVRYGGDEFIILHKAIDENNIIELLNKINEYLAKSNASRGNNSYDLSISYGYSKFEDKNNRINDVIDKADKMLYMKKKNNN